MKYALGLGHQAVRKHERLWVKRGIAALAVVLLLTGGILPLNVMSEAVFADVGDVNVVPDPQLQACINVTKLSRPADTPITPAELASLTASLVATSYPGITSFEGLQYATHINSMTFNDVSISDLTPLGQMTSLKSLNIQTHTTPNGVVDLTPLAPLAAQFTSLTLNGSYYYPVQTTQIIGLSVLPNLTTLSVNANCLTALPGLSSLTHLKSLYLTSNDFGNDIIAQLPNVSYSILNLSSNHISDFTGVPAAGNRILGGQTVVGTDVLLASADQDSLTADPADRPVAYPGGTIFNDSDTVDSGPITFSTTALYSYADLVSMGINMSAIPSAYNDYVYYAWKVEASTACFSFYPTVFADIVDNPDLTMEIDAATDQAIVNFSYSAAGAGAPSFAPNSFALESGTLPAGITLDTSNGHLVGTATETGTFDFAVSATNADGLVVLGAFTLVVNDAPPLPPADTDPNDPETSDPPATTTIPPTQTPTTPKTGDVLDFEGLALIPAFLIGGLTLLVLSRRRQRETEL